MTPTHIRFTRGGPTDQAPPACSGDMVHHLSIISHSFTPFKLAAPLEHYQGLYWEVPQHNQRPDQITLKDGQLRTLKEVSRLDLCNSSLQKVAEVALPRGLPPRGEIGKKAMHTSKTWVKAATTTDSRNQLSRVPTSSLLKDKRLYALKPGPVFTKDEA